MKKPTFLFLLALGLFISACGGGASDSSSNGEEAATEESSRQSGNSGSAENDPAAAMQEAAKQMQEAMKNMGGENGAEPINFRELKELLPDKVAGMSTENKSGETAGAMGFKVSTAEADYRDGNQSIKINIVDAAGISTVMMGMAAWANLDFDRESDTEVERTFTLDGYKAFESYNFNDKSGNVSVLVADRFVVNAEGRNVERKDLQDAVKEVGFKKLEKLVR
jgi:hypothetical protein